MARRANRVVREQPERRAWSRDGVRATSRPEGGAPPLLCAFWFSLGPVARAPRGKSAKPVGRVSRGAPPSRE